MTSSELTAVAIAPDLGERYLDTIYQTNWVQDLYGEDVLSSEELTAAFPGSLTRATGTVSGPAHPPDWQSCTRQPRFSYPTLHSSV